ncbi:hypothetical protein Tcan_08797 [Toxocara canis]|uniref:F-box domain-containing protein n=1 Tax=Toxocara canis TaxID=6265 RepID=A0A0B2UMI7_TOXCA|nr:hypothetical protein Tcan_08797 [Toxocara canis]
MWGGSNSSNWVICHTPPATRLKNEFESDSTNDVPQLPNELIVEIWKHATAQDRRNCRAVCRHWKALYHRCKYPRTRFLNLNISIRDGQYVLFGRKEGKTSFSIEINPHWSFLSSAFQMIELALGSQVDKIEKRGGLISIEGRALTDELLKLILQQKWNIRSVELNGETVFVRNEAMCEFVAKQNEDNGLSDIECLVLRDAIINVGFISDRLLSSFNNKLFELHVHLTQNCKQWLSRTSLSNFSLPLMIRPNATFFIASPLANRITMSALKAAIEEYFKTDWNKTDVPSSVWRNEHGRLSTYPGYYSCTLTLHLNKSVTAQAVAQIEMPGVEKVYFAIGSGTFYQKTVEKEEMGLRGRVLFVKRSPEGCIVARIADAIINVGFISDRLLSSFNNKLFELHVHLTQNCKQWLSRTSLSNFSLPLMIRPNATFFIASPLANRITMSALKAAIEEYFKTDWNKTDVPSSVWRNEHGRLSTYPGYYSCTLTLHLNKSVTAQAVAQIEMPGVEKVYFAIGSGTFYQKTVEKEEMGLRGRVLFVKRSPEGCIVARIAVS